MSSNENHNTEAIPEGYVLITTGPDQEQYVVPEFMVSSLHQTFDGYRKKLDLKAYGRAGCVSLVPSSCRPKLPVYILFSFQVHQFNSHSFGVISEGKIMAPTVPVSKIIFFSFV
jgi:hypothetical protein